MENIFKSSIPHSIFSWDSLGNIAEGRENLGEEMPVLVYRLLEYSMNHVLTEEYGSEKANDIFRKAGKLVGSEFAKNVLNLSLPLNEFIAELQQTLRDLRIGILRIEKFDEETGNFILTVAEDLDCSGLPPTNEVVCNYDEGFLSGILYAYTKKDYYVREVDCWASGARVCRFKGHVIMETAD